MLVSVWRCCGDSLRANDVIGLLAGRCAAVLVRGGESDLVASIAETVSADHEKLSGHKHANTKTSSSGDDGADDNPERHSGANSSTQRWIDSEFLAEGLEYAQALYLKEQQGNFLTSSRFRASNRILGEPLCEWL